MWVSKLKSRMYTFLYLTEYMGSERPFIEGIMLEGGNWGENLSCGWGLDTKECELQGQCQNKNGNIRVVDLIDRLTRTWRRDIIEATFNEIDTNRILWILLALVENEDMLVWRGVAKLPGNFQWEVVTKIVIENYNDLIASNLQ